MKASVACSLRDVRRPEVLARGGLVGDDLALHSPAVADAHDGVVAERRKERVLTATLNISLLVLYELFYGLSHQVDHTFNTNSVRRAAGRLWQIVARDLLWLVVGRQPVRSISQGLTITCGACQTRPRPPRSFVS